jgi:hypothetical protein
MGLIPDFLNPFRRNQPPPIEERPSAEYLPIIQAGGGMPPSTESARLVVENEPLVKNTELRNRYWYKDHVAAAFGRYDGLWDLDRDVSAFKVELDIERNNIPKHGIFVKNPDRLKDVEDRQYVLSYEVNARKAINGETRDRVLGTSNRTEIVNQQQQQQPNYIPPQRNKILGFLGH